MAYQAEKIRQFIMNNVQKHPSDIVAIAAKKFNVTRTTIHRHINTLVKNGDIIKSGIGTNLTYMITDSLSQIHEFKVSNQLNEHDVYQNYFEDIFSHFSKNIQDVCHYGFTEIFNNAIDHARATKIKASTNLVEKVLYITIEDNGIGIFRNIAEFLSLTDLRESILHLTKGKLTTDPVRHTGEGIFFSSRLFDTISIYANGLHYYRDNHEEDWSVETIKQKIPGTKVVMSLSTSSEANLVEVFQAYQDPETLAFEKSEILVELSKLGQETLISRSQAKRVLMGLEKFKLITLDFSKVRLVGQGFVDEVFRVFQKTNEDKKITYVHANPDVEFMIKRSLGK